MPPDGMTTAERTRLDRQDAPERTKQTTTTVTRGPDPTLDRPAAPARSRRGLLRWGLILGGGAVLIGGGLYYWVSGGRYVTTTDAYVEANVLNVATDVSGVVESIPVHDGEVVKAGQILFQLDPQKFQLAVDQAKAAEEQAKLDLEALTANLAKAQRAQAAQAAVVEGDQATLNRLATLVKSHAVTQQEYDNARYKLQADEAQLGSSEAEVKAALARLGGHAELSVDQLPAYKQAQAQLGEALRQMRHATVRAPFDGTVTQVSKLQIGQYLPAGTAAFGLVGTKDFWVEAQPKETALTYARNGDPATVTIDAYPGYTWHGTVASIAPATAQQFSVLPAENSSGNWVKVVQRVPVRVTLQPLKDGPPLSAGMSADVSIDTGHSRSLGDLF